MADNIIKIKANYSFWKHPIRWLKERKTRKVLQLLANYNWKNRWEKEFEDKYKNMILYGNYEGYVRPGEDTSILNEKDFKFYNLIKDAIDEKEENL